MNLSENGFSNIQSKFEQDVWKTLEVIAFKVELAT